MIKISPSILAADFSKLGQEVSDVTAAGADFIHVDVMDGHFVPNISMGPSVVKAIKPYTDKPLDVHLMITPIDPFIKAFADAGADLLTVHPEAGPHLHRTLHVIADHGVIPGLALNPATPLSVIEPVIDMLGVILVMSVNPGFGGQKFLTNQLSRIKAIRQMIDLSGRNILLEVDGGVNASTAGSAINAGATSLVAGTAVFQGGPSAYSHNIAALREAGSREV